MNGPLIWTLALFLRVPGSENGRGRSVLRALAIGALLSLASFYKPQCAIYGLLLSVAHVTFPPEVTRRGRQRALTEVLIIAAVGSAAWTAFFAYFAMTGRFQILYTTMFIYPSYYSGSVIGNLLASLGRHLYPTSLRVTAPLIFLTLLGGIIAWLKRLVRPWLLLFAYAIATQVTVGIPGRFYSHYYQLWLPLFAVGAGWGVVLVGQIIRESYRSWMPNAFAAIALILILQSELWIYTMDPLRWSLQEYGAQSAASEELANEINKFLAPDETLYVLGDEPSFYFLTKRRPAVGAFFLQDVAGGPLAQELTAKTINELQKRPPDLVVILNEAIGERTTGPTPARLGPDHPLRLWVSQHYCPVAINCNALFSVCARPGSALERREAYRELVAELSIHREVDQVDK